MDTPFKRCKIFQKMGQIIQKRAKPRHIISLTFVFILIFYFFQAVSAFASAISVEKSIHALKEKILAGEFNSARDELWKMDSELKQAELSIKRMYPFTKIPGISQEFKAVNCIIKAAQKYTQSGILVADWAEGVPILFQGGLSSLDSMNENDKREILKHIDESSHVWEDVGANIDDSMNLLSMAIGETKIPIINSKISGIVSKIKKYQEIFNIIEPWISFVPSALGYPSEKTYLLLLQNNTELRPTGGFIGTYGILKIKNAEILEFETDNVYNLDQPSKAYNTKIPPVPLQRYIKQSQWFFRDSNWDPDFPTTAQRAIQFYKDERGKVAHFDGVIAFTPEFIEDVLDIVGPVFVDGKEFTAENLVKTLAWHVEKGFVEEGITIYNRKKIIDDVAQQIKEKVVSLSPKEIEKMAPEFGKNFKERHIMAWFENKKIQKIVEDLNWANKILPAEWDYFYVVDANLGSLKSDPSINKTINYYISVLDDGSLSSTVSITYDHTGKFDWKTTRYRTYTRLYVPQGSKLVRVEGNEEKIETTDEHGKTVFGTFISIEPGTSETLSFTYSLPEAVVDKILVSEYRLLVQKQAGTYFHKLNFDIELPFSISQAFPKEVLTKKSGNSVKGSWNLISDREIMITQK